MVDLWEDNERMSDVLALRRSAPDKPVYFDEAFEAAKENSENFAAFNFLQNSRKSVINEHLNNIYEKTGQRVSVPLDGLSSDDLVRNPNSAIRDLKKTYPDLEEIDPIQLEERAKIKSYESHRDYEDMARREKTWGGTAGGIIGSMAGLPKDPSNIIGMGLNPAKSFGLIKTALIWGGLFGTQRAVNEVANAEARDEIQPGYIESGEPYNEVGKSFLGGVFIGALPKAIGNVWGLARHGEWPTGIKDYGNHVMSEAQIEHTNTLAGAAGEAEHRQALSTALDQIGKGEPVRVHIDPEIVRNSRDLMGRLEGETPFTSPIPKEEQLRLTSEAEQLNTRYAELDRHLETLPEGKPEAAEQLAKVQQIEKELADAKTSTERKALSQRRDELLKDTTPEKLQAEAAPLEARRQAEAQMTNIESRLNEIQDQIAKTQTRTLTLAEGLRAVNVGQRDVVPRLNDPRHWMAAEMSLPTSNALVKNTTPEALEKLLASPEHRKAVMHDLEMAAKAHKIIPQSPEEAKRTTIGGENIARPAAEREPMITSGRPGQEVTKPLSEHLKDIKDLENASKELQNCLLPMAEQAGLNVAS